MRKNKKGFTIVELVIVIAVVAVLAAVLVPTFIHLSNKAKEASDKSLVNTLNTHLRIQEAENGKDARNMSEAVEYLKKEGIYASQLVLKSDQDLVYSIDDHQFYLSNDNGVDQSNKHKYFHIYDSLPEEQTWSIYASDSWETATVNLTVGFDTGENDEAMQINYTSNKNVVIRTSSVEQKLTIDNAGSTVYHYDLVGEVQIIHTANASYHESGKAGFIEVSSGRVVTERGGYINTVVLSEKPSGSDLPAAIQIKDGGEIVNKYATSAAVAAANDGAEDTYHFGNTYDGDPKNGEIINSTDIDDVKDDAIDSVTPPAPAQQVTISNWAALLNFATSEEAMIGTVEADIQFLKFPVIVYGTKTLDLNGHTLSLANGEYDSEFDPENGALLYISKDASLTLNDSSGDNSGKICFAANVVDGEADTATFLFCNYGELIINGGNYPGAVATIMGFLPVSFPVILNWGDLTINGGVFEIKNAEILIVPYTISNGYGINYMSEEESARCPVFNFKGGQLSNGKYASQLVVNYTVTTLSHGYATVNDSTGTLDGKITYSENDPCPRPGGRVYSYDPQQYCRGFESTQEYTAENNYTITIHDTAFADPGYYWEITKTSDGYVVNWYEPGE